MIRSISIGIDIGTTTTRVVVGEFIKGEKSPKIIGVGESPTSGLRHGYIIDFDLAVTSVKKAKAMAESSSGIKIRKAFISIGSVTLKGETSSGSAIIGKADGEVTNLDITKAIEESEENINLNNKKIIQATPIAFKLDGKEILGKPEGMRGTKLEVRALFVTCSSQHLENLLEVVREAGIEPIDVVAGPVAASFVALSERQKMVGGALIDIGSETVSIAVFENTALISTQIFSIGSTDITNDIALGLKVTLEEAEDYKLGNLPSDISKKKFDEIIDARLSDIFELVENHLKKIKRNELLPAGVVFVGGGANISGIEELSKSALKLPSKIGTTDMFGNSKTKLRDPSWFTVLGLLMSDKTSGGTFASESRSVLKNIHNSIKSITKQLLP